MKHIIGTVVAGKQKGRELGFPTANIIISEQIEGGIYWATAVVNGKKHAGAVFIYPGGNLFEIHVLDFAGDLYGKQLDVELGEKIREMKKFDNEDDLKKQIAADVEQVRLLVDI